MTLHPVSPMDRAIAQKGEVGEGSKNNRNTLLFSIFSIPELSCMENVIIPGALLLLQRWHDLRPGRRVS